MAERKALIIANDRYEQESLPDLAAPAADAEALSKVLGDPQIGGFTVQVAYNEHSHQIAARIEEMLADGHADDLLLLHFSGHGLKAESGELFFAAPNTRSNRLGSTAVSAEFVQSCLRASRSRQVVLLLDCCYSGAFSRGVTIRSAEINALDSFPKQELGGGRGRAVIAASSAMEYAFESADSGDDRGPQPSLFTSALVEGLATGEADRDEDGWVSLDELYDYIFDKVREHNPNQTPRRQVDMQGEFIWRGPSDDAFGLPLSRLTYGRRSPIRTCTPDSGRSVNYVRDWAVTICPLRWGLMRPWLKWHVPTYSTWLASRRPRYWTLPFTPARKNSTSVKWYTGSSRHRESFNCLGLPSPARVWSDHPTNGSA